MSSKALPSIATVRDLRLKVRYLEASLQMSNDAGAAYRNRALKAEQEAIEWRDRFDKLTARDIPKEHP